MNRAGMPHSTKISKFLLLTVASLINTQGWEAVLVELYEEDTVPAAQQKQITHLSLIKPVIALIEVTLKRFNDKKLTTAIVPARKLCIA